MNGQDADQGPGAGPQNLWAFAGRWRMMREIRDHKGGQSGHASGVADLAPDGTGLIYVESIRLELTGQTPIDATQSYVWRDAAGGVAVFFKDGRAFHQIVLGAGTAQADHWCDPDRYKVRYDFSLWPRWSSVWDVSGPRKGYCMTTQYAPQTA